MASFFFLSGFSFTNIHKSQDCRGMVRTFVSSSLPHPATSQTLRNYLGNYCREPTSTHSWQQDSSYAPLKWAFWNFTRSYFFVTTERLPLLADKIPRKSDTFSRVWKKISVWDFGSFKEPKYCSAVIKFLKLEIL